MATWQIIALIVTLIGSVGAGTWIVSWRISDMESRLSREFGDLKGKVGYIKGRLDGKPKFNQET
ncbi:MAG: hypothetical protein ISN28_08490 [Ectothiorhodospiraceae bacterium AqS1]|nr:hypothetical protein [Ectothiorhodospiraceae bacterium AqS1]